MSPHAQERSVANWFAGIGLFSRLAWLVAVPLLLLALAAAINTQREYAAAERAALDQTTSLARQAAARIDQHYEHLDQFLTALAETARETLTRGTDGDPALLRTIHAMPRHVTGLSILSLDGRMVASTTAPPELRASVNVADRGYFKAALASSRSVIGEPVHSRTSDLWVLISARAVRDEVGRVIGAVSTSSRLDRVHAIAVPTTLPPGTQMTVWNERGIGIASTHEPGAVIGRDAAASPAVSRALRERRFSTKAPANEGQSRFVAYDTGEVLPWIVEVALPAELATAPAKRRLYQGLTLLAAALLLGLAAAARLARRTGEPIRSLAHDAQALGEGDLTHRTRAGGYREVNQLSGAFNNMVNVIEGKQRELKASEERFRSLVMLSSDWYWTQDREYRFTSHSAGRFEDIRLQAADFAGKTRWEMPGAEPVGTTWEAHRALLDARQPWRDLIVRYPDGDGEVQYIASSGEPVFDDNGEFTGYRGVAQLVTARYKLEAQLRESEERLRATLNYSPNVAVQWFDRDGRVRFWNNASTRIFGWREDEVIGRTLDEIGLYAPQQGEAFRAALRAVDREGPTTQPAESAVLRKDGTQCVILSTLFPIPSSTGETLYVCMDVDVTARVRLEKQLRERMDLFRVTLDTAPVAIAVSRATDNIVLLANRAAYHMLGVDPAREDWSALDHWAQLDDARELKRRLREAGSVRDMQAPIRTADGRRLWGLLSAQPARYLDQDVTVATLNDITEHKALEAQRDAAQAALRANEQKFRALTALSSDWYWEQDADFRFTSVGTDDPHWGLPMIGKTRWELNGAPLRGTWADHKALLERHETFRNIEFRLTGAHGETAYLSVSGEPIFGDNGDFRGYRGTASSITERLRLQNELTERMELLRVTLETTPACIGLITQRSARVLLANRAAYETFGVASDGSAWLVQDNWERQEDRRQFLDALKREGSVRDMEVPLTVAGQQRKWMSVSANPARYQNEDVFVVTTNDISVRRALEMQREALLTNLRGANERLRLLSQQVLDAQESERRQIAHELHDEIGQNLTALKLFAGHLRSKVSPEGQPQLEEWVALLDRSIEQVRDLSRLLRPVQLDLMGLVPALRALLDTQARAAGWTVEFTADPQLPRIDTRRETVAYRVVQEALSNAARHADAASVSLALKHADGQLQLTLADDGRGFDLNAVRNGVQQGRSMGLLGMEERVLLAGGTFRIDSAPAQGTRIMVAMPIAAEAVLA